MAGNEVKIKIKYPDKKGKIMTFAYDFANKGAKEFEKKMKTIFPVIIKVIGEDLKDVK